MNCFSYQRLSYKEKVEFTGSVLHAIQNDEQSFQIATTLLNMAEKRGVLNDVVINPPSEAAEAGYDLARVCSM